MTLKFHKLKLTLKTTDKREQTVHVNSGNITAKTGDLLAGDPANVKSITLKHITNSDSIEIVGNDKGDDK